MKDRRFWSVRNVAEYAFCPRLFYLMAVEGIFLPSSDTVRGQAAHLRVDKPDAAGLLDRSPPAAAGAPVEIRSLALSDPELALSGRLDVCEIRGRDAVPVEYRKGRPRRDDGSSGEPSPWPTDRVQVGLQSLLLERAGYHVERAVLYYAAEKLRLTIAFDDSVREEALATLTSAKECAAGARPLPLERDPRCPRCSLQPHCLPDEVNQQRSTTKSEEVTPRKLWPPREDGIHVVAQTEGVRIGLRGSALRITDRDGATVKNLPLAGVESLSVLGGVQVSTKAIHALASRHIPVAYLSSAGRMIAMVDPLDSVSASVRRAQVLRFEHQDVRLQFARALVTAKIANQRTLLRRNHPDLPAESLAELSNSKRGAARATSLPEILGHEGRAAVVYFPLFAGLFTGKPAEEFKTNGRSRRPPPDPINSCLSLAYTMLTHECVAALRVARLEPTIGGYHTCRPGRPALALDLMEPFRPLIGDSLTLSCFNRGELAERHFRRTSAGCFLTDSGRRAFFGNYGRRMRTVITHPVFRYRLTYRRMIVLHARMLAAWLMGEIPSLSFLTTR